MDQADMLSDHLMDREAGRPVTLISSWIPDGYSRGAVRCPAWDHDLGGVEVPEDDGAGEQPVGEVLDDPFLSACRLSLRGPPPRPTSNISGPNTEKAEHSVGACIEKSDQGSEDEDEAAEREARALRFAQGRKS